MNSAEVFRLIGFTLTIFIEGWRCDDVVNDHIVPFEGTLEKGYPQSNLDQSFPSPRIDAKEIHQILHSTTHLHLSLSLQRTYFTLFTTNEFFRNEFGHGIILLE